MAARFPPLVEKGRFHGFLTLSLPYRDVITIMRIPNTAIAAQEAPSHWTGHQLSIFFSCFFFFTVIARNYISLFAGPALTVSLPRGSNQDQQINQ